MLVNLVMTADGRIFEWSKRYQLFKKACNPLCWFHFWVMAIKIRSWHLRPWFHNRILSHYF